MSVSVQSSHARQDSGLLENDLVLDNDALARMNEAVNTAENLDQLLAAGKGNAKVQPNTFAQYRQNSQVSQYEGVTPATGLSPNKNFNTSGLASPRIVSVKIYDPLQHLDSSDEDECTFQPKINPNSARLAQRGDTTDMINENLYNDAADRRAKIAEHQKVEGLLATQKINSTKSTTKSMKIVLQKLHKSLSSLIKDVESSENPGEINFEGLGTILSRLGVFQNLEFAVNTADGEKSSLSINHARIKPERLAKEIAFHENLWRICAVASINTNLVFSDLVLRILMTLVEDKTSVSESATLLLEIIDAKLDSLGLKVEKEKFAYLKLKEAQNLWSMEKVVNEFRRLFEDKTSFMNTYSSNGVLKGKNATTDDMKQSQNSFKPEVNKKSAALDPKHFSETFLKRINIAQEDAHKHNLQDRGHRLNKLHEHIMSDRTHKLAAKTESEVAECTFSPRIKTYTANYGPNTSTSFSPSKTNKSGYFSQALSPTSTSNRHLLLYEVAKTYKEKQNQRTYTVQKKDDNDEDTNCTFKPKINNNSSVSPIKTNFYEGVPNGFKKTVERLNKGVDLNQTKKLDLETIPRGENYEKNKAAEFAPPKFITRPKIKAPEVLVYVDVSIGAGKTGRIGIHKGDNPKILATNFARTYSLNSTMKESLEKLLQSYIESYFAQNPAAKQNTANTEDEEVAAFDVNEGSDQPVKTEETEQTN